MGKAKRTSRQSKRCCATPTRFYRKRKPPPADRTALERQILSLQFLTAAAAIAADGRLGKPGSPSGLLGRSSFPSHQDGEHPPTRNGSLVVASGDPTRPRRAVIGNRHRSC